MRIFRPIATILLSTAAIAQVKPSQIPAPSDVAAPPASASKTKNGLESEVLKPGTRDVRPGKDDVVTISYSAWTSDGKMFDSSVARGRPSEMQLKNMLPGLAEGIQLMQVGESRRLWIPEKLAFKGREGKPKGTLVFDVTLLDIPTHAPADLKSPPADAIKTGSGLVYEVLRPGTGTHHPNKADTVTVHYTGWTTDGKMFDSSLTRGVPSTFPLDRVIHGWTEGVALMVEGEKARFWIPERLAYKGASSPYGDLVFDIELIKIQ
ncbi:MAG TPA: FKBP-type peptidyl-prolyl cis-trans isomerase [Terriglobales bacterium]|jgi:peptidylprolyl isomerase